MDIFIFFIFTLMIPFYNCYNKNDLEKFIKLISTSKAILIGAGAGLSTGAGFISSGKRFKKYFFDFQNKYNIKDMYSGSFYPYKRKTEYWAFMSRNIYLNRFSPFPKNTYNILFEIFKNKNYFILTTNVDHLFQRAGFDKEKMYYMQGYMGLFQCKKPCHNKNYENYNIIKDMLIDQGFSIDEKGELIKGDKIKMEIDEKFIPKCPICDGEMDFNLRIGNNFVQDEGWYKHQKLYGIFLDKYKDEGILYIEIGVGYNTPSIIKYNFLSQVRRNEKSKYIYINLEESNIPKEIEDRSLILIGDVDEIFNEIYKLLKEYNNEL